MVMCQLLLKRGAQRGEVDSAGRTALHWAVISQQVQLHREYNIRECLLISEGCPPSSDSVCGVSAGPSCSHLRHRWPLQSARQSWGSPCSLCCNDR